MNRSDFLRILGIAALSPSVMIVHGQSSNVKHYVKLNKFNPKRWPIYPDRTQFSYQDGKGIYHTAFSYVKISRNGSEYLIPLKETSLGNEELMTKRFEWEAKEISENFIVDEANQVWFDNGFVIKYDPKIHHN